MRALVFAFEVGKLDNVEFENFLQKLFDAQKGLPLGLCKFNVFDLHGTIAVHAKLDELRNADGTEKDPTS